MDVVMATNTACLPLCGVAALIEHAVSLIDMYWVINLYIKIPS